MRYFAVTLLLAAMGAAGYLAWTGLHQPPEVIPSGEVKTVRVDNFAYASPRACEARKSEGRGACRA